MTSHPTIHLIDADFSARKGLTRLLSVAGHRVEAFSSFEAFSRLQSIDDNACLVVDAGLPGFSGTMLNVLMTQKKVSIPIIFISARDDEQSRDKAREAKAIGFFRKPIDGPALLDAIAWALERHGR